MTQLMSASTGLCRHLPGACVWAPSGGSCRCDLKLQQQQQRNHDSSAAVTQTVICTAAGALQQSMAAAFQAAYSLQRQGKEHGKAHVHCRLSQPALHALGLSDPHMHCRTQTMPASTVERGHCMQLLQMR